MEAFLVLLFHAVGSGLILFLLGAGLTLVYGLMGVMNFAHASMSMLGAYLGYSLSGHIGFVGALCVAPVATGLVGAAFERFVLRRAHGQGPLAELLVTFGASYLILELVQWVWGRGPVDYRVPAALAGVWRVHGVGVPVYRLVAMGVSVFVLAGLWWVWSCTRIGPLLRAAATHPQALQTLGYDVPSLLMWTFGAGSALAGLAGVLAGNLYVTEPEMAASVAGWLFVVVVVGGLGSLRGAFVASMALGMVQTLAAAAPATLGDLLQVPGWSGGAAHCAVCAVPLGAIAPMLPYLWLVVALALRPVEDTRQ
ncbi:branched-chain amino acid ABC transporter permease [Candidatus Symbiobacter mobilis]|uniref:Branched-chain amino acid transporter permease protein n=1 Tax=Candidatus Symbiobacter mobilis CR TaxID=946483 RepID=U5NDQ2_9BURK|nr:branched-chain amino acid ABC transporter permease [Candidatus Symbiobacter mobilis]AGX88328.1 branched-chain amino acid transporter permease protein [Candidatus Symbiobacter mobilis CR]